MSNEKGISIHAGKFISNRCCNGCSFTFRLKNVNWPPSVDKVYHKRIVVRCVILRLDRKSWTCIIVEVPSRKDASIN